MNFYGITVVIICKVFEVVKSNIIILMADCNNYLHTLSKKKKVFLNFIIFGENKGGRQVTKCPKKASFFGRKIIYIFLIFFSSQEKPVENGGSLPKGGGQTCFWNFGNVLTLNDRNCFCFWSKFKILKGGYEMWPNYVPGRFLDPPATFSARNFCRRKILLIFGIMWLAPPLFSPKMMKFKTFFFFT